MRKAVYARLDEETCARVAEHGRAVGQTVSAAIEDLVTLGLAHLTTTDAVQSLEKQLALINNELQTLRQERAALNGALQVSQKNESLARAAREQAELVKSQFEQMLSIGVATCGNAGCQGVWRLYDVWRHQCPLCGSTGAKLLDHYTPAPTPAETLRDVLAVVGGTTALIGLLKAISDGGDVA